MKTIFVATFMGETLGRFSTRKEADKAIEAARKRYAEEVRRFGK